MTRGSCRSFQNKLVGSYVYGMHPGGSVLEQAVRKTSGGSPNVKADLAFRRNGEGIQGSFHFQAAAADIAGTVSNGDIRVFINLETGLGRGMPPHAHFSGNDEPLGQLPGFYEIAGNQKDIESLLAHDSEKGVNAGIS